MFLIFEKIIRSRICSCIHWVLKKDKLGIQIRPGWGGEIKVFVCNYVKMELEQILNYISDFLLFHSTFAWVFFLGTWIFNSLWSFSS